MDNIRWKNRRQRRRQRRALRRPDEQATSDGRRIHATPIYGLSNTLSGLSDSFVCDMPYGAVATLAPAASGYSYYSFRGNSVYDPDYTSIGYTAFHYSKLSLLYNRYRVLASTIEVTATNTGTVPLNVYYIATIANSPPDQLAIQGARHFASGVVAPGGPAVWKHTAGATTAKIFGVPERQVRDEDDFAGLVGGNPNNVWYWHVSAFNPGATAGAVSFSVRIVYKVLWSMPLAPST